MNIAKMLNKIKSYFLSKIVFFIIIICCFTNASAANLDSPEALAAWAKSKNWTKSPIGIVGYNSDKAESSNIWIVYDRAPTLTPFNRKKGDDQVVTETGKNITIAGGIPATLYYMHWVRNSSGEELEKWEYYCHDYRVLIRSQRYAPNGQTGSDPLALLEDYIAFANKYLNVKPPVANDVKDNIDELPRVEAGYIMATIQGMNGGKIMRVKKVSDKSGEVLKKGDKIYFGDILITNDVMVKIMIDHSPDKPMVVMKPNTKIRIENKERHKKGGIYTFFGKLFFRSEGTDHRGFKIITSNYILGCEGTEFETAYDPNTGKTKLSVFEGVVSFKCKNNNASPTMVNAGVQATLDNNCNQTLSILDPDKNTAAKAGWEINGEPGTINNIYDRPDGNIILPIADSHVYAYSYRNWNKCNWGKYESIGAGWNPTGGEKRAFLKFDLSGIEPNSINSATLRLYHNHTGGGNAVELGVYRVMSPWQEGNGTYHSGHTEKSAAYGELSWVYQPDIKEYPVVYFNPGQGINKWIEVDVTALVRAWLSGIPNYGIAIKGGEKLSGNPESQYGFSSRESEDASKRPHLVLNGSTGNDENNGVSTNWDADKEDFYSVTGQWSINQYNGYNGTINLQQDQSGRISGTVNWNQYENGTIDGKISGDTIEFTISYKNGDYGFYKGTLAQNGSKIINGSHNAKNGAIANWDADKEDFYSVTGQWSINQYNGYNGTINLQQDQAGRISGTVNWNQYENGTIDGKISGDAVEFMISYKNGDYGFYKGTLAQNGSKIINGSHNAKNGATTNWDASR